MFVTSDEIQKSIWKIESSLQEIQSQNDWDYSVTPDLDDVKYWEVVYFLPGSIGVYAAHEPYIEFYIIYHNLFGICEKFFGTNASNNCSEKLKKYGINLEHNTSWTNLHKMTL